MSGVHVATAVVVLVATARTIGRPAPRPVAGAVEVGPSPWRLVRRLERRLPSLAHLSDRELTAGVVASVGLALIAPPALLSGPVVLVALAVRRERTRNAAHERALVLGLPEMIDLLGVAVGAGLSLPAALETVHPWLPDGLRRTVGATLDRLTVGEPMVDALRHLRDELPPSARRSVAVLIAATRDGAPLGPSLERAAAEARLARRRAAEGRARRLPVLMLLPLVLCVLPAFVLLTLVPLVVGSLDGLSLTDAFSPP